MSAESISLKKIQEKTDDAWLKNLLAEMHEGIDKPSALFALEALVEEIDRLTDRCAALEAEMERLNAIRDLEIREKEITRQAFLDLLNDRLREHRKRIVQEVRAEGGRGDNV